MELAIASDEELAEAAAGGDEPAFAALYQRYATPVHDFAARVTRSRDDAADVAQLAFERAWRNLHRRRRDKRFKPWLFAIVHNTAVELLRRRRPAVSIDDEEAGMFAVLSADADVEADVVSGDVARDVWAAAAALSPTEYAVLHHQLRGGMSHDEIASAMDMKVGAVYTALSRARDAFEECFTALQLARRGRRECPDLDRLLGGSAPAALDRATRRAVREHLGDCERCEANSRRYVAPAEIFAALAPLAPPAGLLEISRERARTRRGRLRGSRVVAAGVGAALVATAVGVVALASGGGPGDRTRPDDPERVESPSHEVGAPSANRVVEVRWPRARDRGDRPSGVAGYSVSWTEEPRSVPHRQRTGDAETTSARSPELADGEWWFHLSTVDEAGNWTSTVHFGPLVIVSALACPTTEVLVGFWEPRLTVEVDPSIVRAGAELSLLATFTDEEGRNVGRDLESGGVRFGLTVDGTEVATAPVAEGGVEIRGVMPPGPPGCTSVALTHGVPIVRVGVQRTAA